MRPTPTGEQVVVETKAGTVRGFWRTHSAAFSASRSPSRRTVIFGSSHRCRRGRGAEFGMYFDTRLRRNARRWQK
jgi:hypothetical protein